MKTQKKEIIALNTHGELLHDYLKNYLGSAPSEKEDDNSEYEAELTYEVK